MTSQQNSERRRHERLPYQAPVHLRLDNFEPARSLNLSVGGIGIRSPQSVTVGTELEVVFLDMTVSVLGVVRTLAMENGEHVLGVQFRSEEQDVVEVLLRLQPQFQNAQS